MTSEKQCEQCSQTYQITERFYYNGIFHKQAWLKSRFCGNKCSAQVRAGRKERSETRNCISCNSGFKRKYKYSDRQWEQAKYCSPFCQQKSLYKKVEKVCSECSETYRVKKYETKTSRYCSRECMDAYRRKNSVTPYQELVRKRLHPKWRKAVFERDNYTCQECGNRGGELQADHIIQFAYLLSIGDYEKLQDISNGRTLCYECHKSTETWGRKLNKGVADGWHKDFSISSDKTT